MSKLDLWSQLSKTDRKFTKPFGRAGGFKGDSIDPLWRIMRMTEMFGPVGEGWTINEPHFETLLVPEDKKVLVFCKVSVQVNGKDPVWGVGGNCAFQVFPGKDGRPPRPHSNDEAYKMAFTDAIGNALKAFGMSADIYLGKFDADKYVAEGGHQGKTKPHTTPPERTRKSYQRQYVKPGNGAPPDDDQEGPPPHFDDAPPCQPDDAPPDHFEGLDDEELPPPVFKNAKEIAQAVDTAETFAELALYEKAYEAAAARANFRQSTKDRITDLFEQRAAYLNQRPPE